MKPFEKEKSKYNGYVCGKPICIARACRHQKYNYDKTRKDKRKTYHWNLVAIIIKANVVGGYEAVWWVYTGITRHICGNRSLFTSYELVGEGMKIFIGNSLTFKVVGKGSVELRLKSRKSVIL